MSLLYVLDYQEEMLSVGSDDLRAAEFCSNEVQILNRVSETDHCILMLHYNSLKSKTPEFISMLRKANPQVIVVVIGHELGSDEIINCVFSGATGYQNIDTLSQYLGKLIKVVEEGEAWISRKVVAKLIEQWRSELEG